MIHRVPHLWWASEIPGRWAQHSVSWRFLSRWPVVMGVARVGDGGSTCHPQPPVTYGTPWASPRLFQPLSRVFIYSLVYHLISLGLGSRCTHLKSVAGIIILIHFTGVCASQPVHYSSLPSVPPFTHHAVIRVCGQHWLVHESPVYGGAHRCQIRAGAAGPQAKKDHATNNPTYVNHIGHILMTQ